MDWDSLYQWPWQEGRLQAALADREAAKGAYRKAIATLQQLRRELASAAADVQFDFQTQVEPAYREFLSLLLEGGSPPELEEALSTFQLLQVAELENFFQDPCLEGQGRPLRELLSQHQMAAITAISLPEKTHLLLLLPDGRLTHHAAAVGESELNQRLRQWRSALEDPFSNQHLLQGQALYDLLVRPLRPQLEAASPRALLFASDGLLRNVPAAALHDGRRFLVESYAIANSLGLSPALSQVRAPQRSLAFGLAAAVPPFPPLPNAARETELVQSLLGGERFLDREFTQSKLKERLQGTAPAVLHLATHGQFGGTLERTFIQAFDRPVGLRELESLLSQSERPLDLLVLSACETAAGNRRSVLGLAGVALRSGVRSAVGSLWSVNDEAAAELFENFYLNWRGGMAKVEALRQAQLSLIRVPGSQPHEWSSFVLFGSWL